MNRAKRIGLMTMAGLVGLTASAVAAVPWWAHKWRTMQVQVSSCSSNAQDAIEEITGNSATVSSLNSNTKLIRGFHGNAGIFIECSASTTTVCGKPKADLSILVFSNSNDAVALRDQVNDEIGDPFYVDCP